MATTPAPIRLAKSRQRARIIRQAGEAGYTVHTPDLLLQRDDGSLWSWTFDSVAGVAKWTKL